MKVAEAGRLDPGLRPVKVSVTPVAVAVAAWLMVIVVAFVTPAMVVLAGIPAPEIFLPTSANEKLAVAEVTVVFELVAPSVTLATASPMLVEQASKTTGPA